MDELKEELALHLLRNGSKILDRRQLEAVVTVFMMLDDGAALNESSKGIDQGRYGIDSRFVSRFFDVCPPPLKTQLFDTFATSRLDPSTYKRLLSEAWNIATGSISDRVRIALDLEGFLRRNPGRAEEYRDFVLELLRSPSPRLCVRGLYQVSYLNDVEERDLSRIQKKLSAADADLRMNALNGLCEWVKRAHEVSPRVLAFCTSPEIRERAREIFRSDPGKYPRTCAYWYLRALGAYHRDQRPASKRRRPQTRSS